MGNELVNLVEKAKEAGRNAVQNLIDSGGIPAATFVDTRTGEFWIVEDGVCGFAWVNLKPANSKLAKYLVSIGMARKDTYYGGVTIWVSDYNQSMAKKEAYAYAFAKVLSEAGYKAYSASRMD